VSVISTDDIAVQDPETYDWPKLVDDLNRLLRLKTTPIGMKMFATVDEMAAVPKIRRPKDIHTTDKIVAQACRLGWTVGITNDDLVGAQCGAVRARSTPRSPGRRPRRGRSRRRAREW
jgi:hypothetical protein